MAKKRGGLGRGLESLFEDTAPSFESDNRIETLPLREIEPDPAQPRKTLDEETLNTAMKALFEIQKSGRTVGIISHVAELKSRIPAQIRILDDHKIKVVLP